MPSQWVCVDFGSTFTKVLAVDADGVLTSSGSARTTIDTDVMDGYDAAIASAGIGVDDDTKVLAASSAGGGLRLAVVGYERAITSEAGYRVGLSAGARVCHVASGELGDAEALALLGSRPDVVLLVGGTDGGNADVLLHNARVVGRSEITAPVVAAGNRSARDQVVRILRRHGLSVRPAENVLPRIGVLDPHPARESIREVFISHVIGGKHLSDRVDLSTWVQAATPDAVLSGVELLADGTSQHRGIGDVVVVDVGGATTDVYSVTTPDADEPGAREAVATLWRSRTVEGDLGVRWNATGIVAAAHAEGLMTGSERDRCMPDAERRVKEPGLVPETDAERTFDRSLAAWAATVALRRHARPHTTGEVRYPGKDLRRVRTVVGSGGVLRHSQPSAASHLVAGAIDDPAGGWQFPERANVVVDRRYVLAAAGLIGRHDPEAAMRLLASSLLD